MLFTAYWTNLFSVHYIIPFCLILKKCQSLLPWYLTFCLLSSIFHSQLLMILIESIFRVDRIIHQVISFTTKLIRFLSWGSLPNLLTCSMHTPFSSMLKIHLQYSYITGTNLVQKTIQQSDNVLSDLLWKKFYFWLKTSKTRSVWSVLRFWAMPFQYICKKHTCLQM